MSSVWIEMSVKNEVAAEVMVVYQVATSLVSMEVLQSSLLQMDRLGLLSHLFLSPIHCLAVLPHSTDLPGL